MQALVQEIAQEKHYLGGNTINTIYFGGGTPSLLSTTECTLLLQALKNNFSIAPDAEITLEANPDDISAEKLQQWQAAGINRLSIGVQSFFENELQWMNRAHNAQQALESLQLAIKFFENITIDLIYGSPLLTNEMWRQNVDMALSLGIPHLSCYALTVEEKTPLHKRILKHQSLAVDNDKQATQFLLLMEWLKEIGYEHYEVSNFAKPGFRSRHNASYWKGIPYLGIGPSAHSFNGRQRRWNVANNQQYMQGISASSAIRTTETLTMAQRFNEYVMIALRTAEGINLTQLEKAFGTTKKQELQQQVKKFISAGFMQWRNNNLQLTNQGMLRADGIASDLFWME